MTLNLGRRATAIALLAIAAVLVLASPGLAQQNSDVFPWNSGGGQGGYSYPGAYPPAAPAAYPPAGQAVNPPANAESSRAFYPSFASAETVRINVTVPTDAKITFNGAPTMQTGTSRRFVSPALSAGQYSYEIQAVWMENGQEKRQSRSVAVQPGDVVQVTITPDGMSVRSEP